MVRNISMSGARSDFANPIGLPRSFTLVIATDHYDQRVGVAFE